LKAGKRVCSVPNTGTVLRSLVLDFSSTVRYQVFLPAAPRRKFQVSFASLAAAKDVTVVNVATLWQNLSTFFLGNTKNLEICFYQYFIPTTNNCAKQEGRPIHDDFNPARWIRLASRYNSL
jgi:hypothetical protein